MMDKIVKKEWLEALRSGDFNPGLGSLCEIDNNGDACYCCLGVLAEVVLGEDCWEPGPYEEEALTPDGDNTGFLSTSFLKDVGLEHKLALRLAEANDDGCTFEELADMIEYEA